MKTKKLKYKNVYVYLLFCMGVKLISCRGVRVDLVYLKTVLSGIFRHKRVEATQRCRPLHNE